jgi:ABC-type bacteriocin/lantibiotic exporter with double-glycine peptidase domain
MEENKPRNPLKRFARLLQVERKEIYSILLFAIFSGIINLSLPLGIQSIINLIGGGIVSTSWIILVIIVILGVAMTGVLQVFQLSINENLQQKIFAKSAFEFSYRIPRFKMESTDQYYIPEMVMRFFETTIIQKGLSKILVDFSVASLQILFGLILLSLYHPFFIIYSLLFILFVYIIFRLTGKKGVDTSLKESGYKYDVVYWLVDLARSMDSFKMAGKTDLPLRRTDDLLKKYITARQSHFGVLKTQYYNLITFKVLVTAGLLLIGGLLVIEQQMNIGQFVAAEIIIILLISSVEKLIYSTETIYDVLTAVEKIASVTDIELERVDGNEFTTGIDDRGMAIELRDYKYRFNFEEEYILNNINLKIEPGDKVCLSGFNGSGKSMLMHTLASIFHDFEGSLLYNDIPLANINLEYLREQIGSSFIKEDIIQGSIIENITMGRESVNFEDVINASKMVGLHEYIQSMPKGYETYMHPEGIKLPKSRILKIKLARCIIAKPKLLLIEDHFNLLEKKYKEQVLEFLLDKNNKWTIVMVSNDIEIAKKMDYIVTIDDGKIIDKGALAEIQNKEWFKNIMKA